MHIRNMHVHVALGAGAGEGDTYQRVHVDDGVEAVGVVDRLVHQAVCVPAHFSHHHQHTDKGDI